MVSKILTIIILFLILLISGCLPLNLYPTRICENNEQYIGIGIGGGLWSPITDLSNNKSFPHFTAYGRAGGPNNFDFGFEFGTFGFPGYFMFSGRKGFHLKTPTYTPYYNCQCIILDIGIGTSSLILPHYRMSLTYFHSPLSVTLGINENSILGSYPSGSGGKSINSIYLKIAMEQGKKGKKRGIIPYFYVSYQTHEEDQMLGMNFPSFFLSNAEAADKNITKYINAGIGATFNWSY
ncbi:MAG: hypothetical protein SVK54_01610 [candidate division WOR-3 bacterium]|nr:hypothetical protein [candidate division WOR-3 bacterium]